MDEHPPRPQPPSAPVWTSRRWFLIGGLAVLAGGGAGVGAQFVHSSAHSSLPLPPDALVAAAAAERALIADLDATTGGSPAVRRVIVQARADHAAHLTALTALLGHYRAPAASSSPARPLGTPRTRAQLRAAEQQAAANAARHAQVMVGGPAALLASIAACEATHVELLQAAGR